MPQVAVGAIVFRKQHLLLVKRKFAPSKNKWAIPGGRIKWGETLQKAAEREIFEETRIKIKAAEAVYVFDYIKRENGQDFHYVIIDLEAEYLSGELAAGDDAREVRWVAKDKISEMELTASTRKLLKQKYNI